MAFFLHLIISMGLILSCQPAEYFMTVNGVRYAYVTGLWTSRAGAENHCKNTYGGHLASVYSAALLEDIADAIVDVRNAHPLILAWSWIYVRGVTDKLDGLEVDVEAGDIKFGAVPSVEGYPWCIIMEIIRLTNVRRTMSELCTFPQDMLCTAQLEGVPLPPPASPDSGECGWIGITAEECRTIGCYNGTTCLHIEVFPGFVQYPGIMEQAVGVASMSTTDLNVCAETCSHNSSCVAFAFIPQHYRPCALYLNNEVSEILDDKCSQTVTYVRIGPPEWHCKRGAPRSVSGNVVPTMTALSSCMTTCLGDNTCRSAYIQHYKAGGAKCTLLPTTFLGLKRIESEDTFLSGYYCYPDIASFNDASSEEFLHQVQDGDTSTCISAEDQMGTFPILKIWMLWSGSSSIIVHGNTSMICDTSSPTPSDLQNSIYVYTSDTSNAFTPTGGPAFLGTFNQCSLTSEVVNNGLKECAFECTCGSEGCYVVHVALMDKSLYICEIV